MSEPASKPIGGNYGTQFFRCPECNEWGLIYITETIYANGHRERVYHHLNHTWRN